MVAVSGPNANEASTTKAGIFLNIVFWDTFVIHHGLMISLLCDAPIGKCGTLIRFWLRPWNWPSVSSAGKITRDFLKSPMTLNLSLVTKVTACGQNQKRGWTVRTAHCQQCMVTSYEQSEIASVVWWSLVRIWGCFKQRCDRLEGLFVIWCIYLTCVECIIVFTFNMNVWNRGVPGLFHFAFII